MPDLNDYPHSMSINPSDGKPVPNMMLTGSNVEQALGSTLPSKANLIGISDGTNIRAMQGNTEGTLLASAARTTTTTSPTQSNVNARGLILALDVTAASGTGGLNVFLSFVDPVSGKTTAVNLPISPAITATGTYYFVYSPNFSSTNLQTVYKQVLSIQIPKTFRVQIFAADSSSYTYSLGYSLLV